METDNGLVELRSTHVKLYHKALAVLELSTSTDEPSNPYNEWLGAPPTAALTSVAPI